MSDAAPRRDRDHRGPETTTRAADRVSAEARGADHAEIARLTDDLLPALIAKLSSTQLGEIEVREADWHIRLRRPYGSAPGEGRRSSDRPSRMQPGHEGHGHGRAAPEAYRGGRAAGAATQAGTSTNGSSPRSVGDGADGGARRTIATSPAVGIFRPGSRAGAGTRVRSGDVLGAVDVLGVPQDVTSPVDGIVGSTLVEAGTAVEYGQELIRIELASPAETR